MWLMKWSPVKNTLNWFQVASFSQIFGLLKKTCKSVSYKILCFPITSTWSRFSLITYQLWEKIWMQTLGWKVFSLEDVCRGLSTSRHSSAPRGLKSTYWFLYTILNNTLSNCSYTYIDHKTYKKINIYNLNYFLKNQVSQNCPFLDAASNWIFGAAADSIRSLIASIWPNLEVKNVSCDK